ncbi:MAG: hypothetical protein H6933_07920 [Burkholderiaceae bacterium]|nr:hypothetical protein [Burkholderiaceae bacterium]
MSNGTHRTAATAVALMLMALAAPATAGTWGATRTLEGPFAVSSPPESPRVVMNAGGEALLAWNATGRVRFAEKPASGRWTRSATVPGGATGAGPVAAALSRGGLAAIAWTTVATRYTPSKLLVSWRVPGGRFGAAVEVAPGIGVWQIQIGTACDGSVTLLWVGAQGVTTARQDGTGDSGACDGVPVTTPWGAPQPLSAAQVGATLPDLALNDAGAALAAWQEGSRILAALRPAAGDWGPAQVISVPTAFQTWNAKAALDAQGRPAVGFLDGTRLFVVRGEADGVWSTPVLVSGSQSVAYPALGGNAAGDLVAAWQALDAGNAGSIWYSGGGVDGTWSAPARLSGVAEDAAWPSVAVAADGGLALVAWVDQSTNVARAAVDAGAGWTRGTLGPGWWGGTVPVAAGAGAGMAGWAVPAPGNPNAATLVARPWR